MSFRANDMLSGSLFFAENRTIPYFLDYPYLDYNLHINLSDFVDADVK